ncbi:MAG: alpha/beta hydrolase [Nitriliruptoraceae bacterium]
MNEHFRPASEAPAWFIDAVDDQGEHGEVVVDGAGIHFVAWGARTLPTLVLVHGGAAHAAWWSAHGPVFAQHHRTIAVDLSGHGDSARRDVYHPEVWAREALAVAEAAGGQGRPVMVGHSMGGFVTILAAARFGHLLDGAIMLDTPVRRPDPESDEGRGGRMFRTPKVYPDRATAMKHFHLVPSQPCDNGWLLEHIAYHSLRETSAGWTWKFDPHVFVVREGPVKPGDFADDLARSACRVAIVNGAQSAIVDRGVREYMAELLADSPAGAAGVPFVEIPEARHHLLLDQPIATITAIRAVLATWRPVGTAPNPVVA